MRYKLLLIVLLASVYASAQNVFPLPIGSPNILQQIPRGQYKLSLGVPLVADTSTALMGGLDSLGLVVQVRSTGVWWKRDTVSGGGHKWTQVGASTGSPGVWGSITGTLGDQGDLLAALNAKQNALGFTPIAPGDTAAMLSTRPLLSYVQQNFYPLTGNPGGFITNNGLSNLINQLQVINAGGVDSYGAGLYSARPSAGTPRRFYFATDSLKIYYDNGSVWLTVAGGSGGGGSSVWGGITGTLPAQTDLNNALNLKLNKTDTATMLGAYYRTPLGAVSQYVRGNGSLATTDTSMIPSFSLKVRSEFSALGPILYNNGSISADTTTGLTHLVNQNLLKNSIDTFKIPHKGLINFIYPGGSDTIVDKGLKNKGNVKFFTDPVDSAIWASTDTSAGGLATQTMLLSLNAANLTAGTIPSSRFGTASISPAAINATGFSSSGLRMLVNNGTWALIPGDSGITNILVVQKANLDSIYSSSGIAGVLPLTTYLLAGAMDPAELKKIDSSVYLANTRQGDSLAYSTAAHDSIYIKGLDLTNGGNIAITKNHTQQKLSYALSIASTYPGQASIVTVGTIGAGVWQGNPLLPTYGGVPSAGTLHQLLAKNSSTNYDDGWLTPGQTDVNGWLGYTAENTANKVTSLGTTNTKYPTENAVKTYIDGSFAGNAGNGLMNLTNQSSNPATPSSGVDIFSRSANSFSIKGANAAVYTFAPAGTGNNTYAFPDLAGGTDNVVTTNSAQTLYSKILSAPQLNLGSDAAGDMYYRNSSGLLAQIQAGTVNQVLMEQASGVPLWGSGSSRFSQTASGAAVTGTSTPATILGTGVKSLTALANTLSVGTKITMHGWGAVATTTGTQTLTINFVNSTTSSGGGFAVAGGLPGAFMEMQIDATILTTGTSGTMAVEGKVIINGVQSDPINNIAMAINTTIDQTFDIQAKWGASGNSVNTLPIFTLKIE